MITSDRDPLFFLENRQFTPPDIDWNADAQATLQEALKIKRNTNVAKNVILFLGDGMGVSTVTGGRIYAGQKQGKSGEEHMLSFENFPSLALSKVCFFFLTGTILFLTFKFYIIAMSSGTGRIPMNTRMRCHSLFITDYIVCMKYLSNYGTGVIIILNIKNSITSNKSK